MVRQTVAVAALAIAIFVFMQFQPLAYGGKWTQAECNKLKLFDTWDWDCNTFHTTYDQYALDPTTVDSSIPSSAPPKVDENSEALVTPQVASQPPVAPVVGQEGGKVINREEKVEYRDEQGNLLNDEQVAELKGKVSFEVLNVDPPYPITLL